MGNVLNILTHVNNISEQMDKLDVAYSKDTEDNLTNYISVLEFVVRTATTKLNGAKALQQSRQGNNEGFKEEGWL
jgi:ABC-type Zn uptake system ZnuABC Zn-binding protein ZnuA